MSLNNSNSYFRIFVVGTGFGLDYQFSYTDTQDGDFEFFTPNSKILVDCMSIHYLEDSVIDYSDDLFEEGFVIKYPKITNIISNNLLI